VGADEAELRKCSWDGNDGGRQMVELWLLMVITAVGENKKPLIISQGALDN